MEQETTQAIVSLVGYYAEGIGAYTQQRANMDEVNDFLADTNEIEIKFETDLVNLDEKR